MKIIRGELTPASLIPPTTRYDATCNCIQVTPDRGTTWQEAAGQDPRTQPAYLKPPVSGSAKRCDAAANMVAWIKSIIDEVIAALTAGATALLLANGLLKFIEGIFPFAAYFIELMFELAVDLIGTGAIDINAAFDSTTYDALLCIFECHLDENGQLNESAYTLIGAAIVDQLNTTAATIMSELLFITGFVGLSNAGAAGHETGDCSGCDCGWCYQWLPTAGDGGWVFNGAPGVFVPDAWGTFDSSGWSSVSVAISPGDSGFCHYEIANIYKTFTAGNVTHFEFAINFTAGTQAACWSGQNEIEITGSLAGANQFHVLSSGLSDGANQLITWDGNVTIDKLEIRVEASAYRPSEGGTPGSVEIICLQAQGFGTSPFGDSNC